MLRYIKYISTLQAIQCHEKSDNNKMYQWHTHTHTHPFNGSFSGTTQVSRYQKGKTNLDFTEARDSEWQWHQLGLMQASTLLQTDNHTSTPPLSFLQAGCPSCRPTNSVKALKEKKCINDIKHKHMQPFNGHLSGTTQVNWYQTKKKKNLHSQQGHPLYCALSQRGLLDQIKRAYNQSQPDGRLKRTASALSNYGSVCRQSWSQCNIKISKKKT